jgi:cytochrome c oxidase subunit 2
MLLRVYVDSQQDFKDWVEGQRSAGQRSDAQGQSTQLGGATSEGQHIFETTACINCHAVAGTAANGRFGPDLTHLMSRDTIAAGAAPNTRENLRLWIQNPDAIKPGSLMPAMQLNEHDLDALTSYLETLR